MSERGRSSGVHARASRGSVRQRLRRGGALIAGGVLAAGLVATPVPASASVQLVDSQGDDYSYGLPNGDFDVSELGSTIEDWVQDQLADLFGYDRSTPGQEVPGWRDLPGSPDLPDSGGRGGGDQGGQGVDSDAATADESTGVVIIDTELYSGSAAAGTGVVLTAGGQVLTNYHVVEGSTEIEVTVATTGRTYTADLVGASESQDVAVLQLEDASGLQVAPIDDDQVAVGDDVTAVGNAGGTGELSAADGEVTALNAQITTTAEDGSRGETLNDLIETDADVVSGDSGGPLIDDEGEVVGIDTAASTGAEVNGYAIPIDDALRVVSMINSGTETDQVRIGAAAYLGVQVSDVMQTGSEPGHRDESSGPAGVDGAGVVGATEGSPAADAGVTEGSVITGIGSETIGSVDDLTDALSAYQPGDQVRIEWTDGSGEQHTDTVTLESSPIN